jgi:cellulose synthase/poly-beta-1,6-N-acetylglucosamine synthase-like glycosyltransferase
LKNNPKVSIVIACYNYAEYIEFAIKSIINQTYKNWELIIVNDNSVDATKEILNKYKSKNIKTINLKKNVGPYRATNLAFKIAKGKYIAILDADDYSHPKRIASQVLQLEKDPEIGLVITNYKLIDQNNIFIKSKIFISQENFNKRFPCENLVCNSSAMFRSKFIKELNFYNKDFFYMNDYSFYLKIFIISKIKIIKKFYTFYRVHKKQRTQVLNKKIILKENFNILLWSMKKGLININNVGLFLRKFSICFIKYFFAIVKN